MKISSKFIYIGGQVLILGLSLITNWYTLLVMSELVLIILMILNKMGKGIVLRESTAALYVITCLLMPWIGYRFYTSANSLANIWRKYMPVSEDDYFGFALPAIVLFTMTVTWPLSFKDSPDEGNALKELINRIKIILRDKKNIAISIVVIGSVVGRIVNMLPGGLQFFATLFFFGSFAGLLYIYYTPAFPYKKWLMGGFMFFILYSALGSGMFTIVAYMGITIFSFFLLSRSPSLFRKIVILVFAVMFMIVLQNTKETYRKFTWTTGEYQGNKLLLFGDLLVQNFQRGEMLIENKAFFAIYSRTNQGFNVALVMRRIPSFQPHDGGVNLLTAFASAFVPRFLWPDKPEAGGKFNMKYYTGITIRGWSTNIGPLGEAYGSFGVTGGIIFMGVLGLFVRWAYKKTFDVAKRIPLVICWLPVLFFQVTYSGETDTLQILNSLMKSSLFIYILCRFLPAWFGLDKKSKSYRLPGTSPSLN